MAKKHYENLRVISSDIQEGQYLCIVDEIQTNWFGKRTEKVISVYRYRPAILGYQAWIEEQTGEYIDCEHYSHLHNMLKVAMHRKKYK